MARRLVFAFLLFLTMPLLAQENALPDKPHILVFGSASARALPDRFRLMVTIEVVDPSAHAARRRTAELFESTLRSIRRTGLPETEIEATTLSIGTKMRWDEKAEEDRIVGTEVSRSISARFDSVEKLEGFLAGLKTSEEVRVDSVRAELAAEQLLRQKLRAEAIADSRSKAESIAEAYGVELGALYSVSDVAPQIRYGIQEGVWPAAFQWQFGRDGSLERVMNFDALRLWYADDAPQAVSDQRVR